MLKEVDPARTQILYCVTQHDQTNIIASLIAKNLGIPRVVTMIENEEFLSICEQLKLKDTIIPISKHLVGLTKFWLTSSSSGVANTPSADGADIHMHEIRSWIIANPSAL